MFRDSGLGIRVRGLGFGLEGSGFCCLGLRVEGLGLAGVDLGAENHHTTVQPIYNSMKPSNPFNIIVENLVHKDTYG